MDGRRGLLELAHHWAWLLHMSPLSQGQAFFRCLDRAKAKQLLLQISAKPQSSFLGATLRLDLG